MAAIGKGNVTAESSSQNNPSEVDELISSGAEPQKVPSQGPKANGLAELAMVDELRTGLTQLDFLGVHSHAVLTLRRACVAMLLRAVMVREGLAWPKGWMTEEQWRSIEELEPLSSMVLALTADQKRALAACFGEEGEHLLLGLEYRQRRELGRALKIAEIQLTSLFQKQARKRRVRWWLWAALITTVVVCSMGWLGWLIWRIEHQTRANLAYRRPVRGSSSFSAEYQPSRLVDGIRTELGFHTKHENGPFAVIDLGKVTSFERVVVYNRTDCCFNRAVPLVVEVSDDDSTYLPLAERNEVFERWEASTPHAQGRFLRLRLNGTNMLHLNEVEIY